MRIRPVHHDDIRAMADPARACATASHRGQPVFYAYCNATGQRVISLHLVRDLDAPGETYYRDTDAPTGGD